MKAIQKTKSKKLLSERVTAMEGDPRGAFATWGRRMAGRTRSIFIVLRHGILSLYSYIRKFVPWRSRTSTDLSDSSISSYIRSLRNVRIAGITSSFLFGLLALAIIIPLYNVTGTEDTEAATGTAIDSNITFTSTRASATVDLTPTSASGTFASSTSGTTDAAFSITTTNSQGYELKIKSTSGTILKPTTTTSDSDGLSTISTSGITSSSFANNTWGYLPSYYNSTSNTTKYYPATTSDVTLRKTTSANNTAHNYTIGLGAKADLTKTSGTYTLGGNKGSLVLTYVANPTAYSITFNKGNTTDTVSNMPYSSTNNNVSGSVSATSITITDGIPTRTGYDFKGWCTVLPTTTNGVDSCKNSAGTTGTTYNATGATSWTYGIDRTSSNTVTLYALWSAKTYTITVNNGGNTTVGGTGTYKYGDTITLTATPTSNTTCATYGTPSWTKTSGEGTLNATSGTSVTFTVGLGNATITATSAKTDVKQTITLSRSNANSISIAGTSYTSSSVSLKCGTYNITGTFPTGYKFSSWSTADNVTVASTNTLATTMTVSGAGTLTLNGTQNTYNLVITGDSYVSAVSVKAGSTSGTSTTCTKSGTKFTCSSLTYSTNYYLYPTFSSGYEFSSWAKTDSATNASLGSTSTMNTYYKMGAGAGALTLTSKSSCTTATNLTGTMQTFSPSSYCVGSSGTLTDSRDNTSYRVAKLADGKWWMLDNLRLNLVAKKSVLSSSNTNATDTELGYLKNGGGTTSDQYATSGVISWPSSSWSCSVPWVAVSGNKYGGGTWDVNTTVTSYGSGSGKVGAYYNYCAASAGTYCYGNGESYGTSSGNATADICPKGWQMPSTTSSNNVAGSYYYLYNTAYSKNASNFRTALSTPLSGVFESGSADKQGFFGYFWSSTRSNNSNMCYLSVGSSSVSPTYDKGRSSGLSVRCVLKEISGCFTSGSEVMVSQDGTTKPIEDINIGDEVVSYNTETGEYKMTKVIDRVMHLGDERATKLAKLTLENGNSVTMTLNHPVLTTEGFKAVSKDGMPTLTAADTVITSTGESKIKSLDIYDTDPTITYNFVVEGSSADDYKDSADNYIVDGIIVRNIQIIRNGMGSAGTN